MSPLVITFVTGNAGKVETAREHLAPLGIKVQQARLDLDEIQSLRVQDVAIRKARQAFSALGCPLIIDDSAFGIDELGGFPGPMAKYALSALGAAGIARLADLTATRACHFLSCLVYIDSHGEPRAFTGRSHVGTVAVEPAGPRIRNSWSELWNVVIPEGCTAPLSALPPGEAERVSARWKQESTFTQFGEWLLSQTAAARQSSAASAASRDRSGTA